MSAALAALAFVRAVGAGSSEKQMPACQMGLVWPNASDAMGMIASLSRNECALTALQNHQKMHGVPANGMGVAIAYSYCESALCQSIDMKRHCNAGGWGLGVGAQSGCRVLGQGLGG